ncbi:SAF domain-containing protein [soil metagenome]
MRLRLRRGLLRRRRLLASLLTAVAVWAGLSATAGPATETVPVLVAAHDLPGGVALSPDDIVVVGFRPGTEPSAAFGDAASLAGRLLAAPMSAGEPITTVRLVGDVLADAQPGRRAVPLRLPDPGMVALLEVGDLIDLIAADPEDAHVVTVATGVPVLAVPANDPGGTATTSGLPGGLIVVGLTPAEVAPVSAATLASFVTFTWAER